MLVPPLAQGESETTDTIANGHNRVESSASGYVSIDAPEQAADIPNDERPATMGTGKRINLLLERQP
jgi:hypothetical protein